jgi:hypothetical protein
MGQIERLFISANSRNDEDLINSAALAVFRNSGTVARVESPSAAEEVAAILRYRPIEPREPERAGSQTLV